MGLHKAAEKKVYFNLYPSKTESETVLTDIFSLSVREIEDPEKERKKDFSQVQGYDL